MSANCSRRIASLLSSAALVFALVGVEAAPALAATVCYVNWQATGAKVGTSWVDAYTHLQSAVNEPRCTEIWVAQGTYTPMGGVTSPPDPRVVYFEIRSSGDIPMALYGGFDGTETLRSQRNPVSHPTILSGDIGTPGDRTDNSIHVVVTIIDSTSSNLGSILLDGFTVRGGYADAGDGGGIYSNCVATAQSVTLANMIIRDNATWMTSSNQGGGMYVNRCKTTISKSVFTNNSAYNGGGLFVTGTSTSSRLDEVIFDDNLAVLGGALNSASALLVTNSIFRNNVADIASGTIHSYGAGLYGSATLTNVLISGNQAKSHVVGTTVYGGRGGGVYGGGIMQDVTFDGNQADVDGGGLFKTNTNAMTNVTFTNNIALTFGGGMYLNGTSGLTLTNVTFYGNIATAGGGMYNSAASPNLLNVTFSANVARTEELTDGFGGAMANENSPSGTPSLPTVANSIFWGNLPVLNPIHNSAPSGAVVSYSVVEGGYNGTANSSTDPLLGAFGLHGGYTQTVPLLAGSPAIDAGLPSSCSGKDQRGFTRPFGLKCDRGSYEFGYDAYVISGTVGVAYAALNFLDGTDARTVLSDGLGNYKLAVSSGWSGKITPSKTGYVFSPAYKQYSNVTQNKPGEDYLATVSVIYIVAGNAGTPGATITYAGNPGYESGSTATDGSGNYSFTIISGWYGTVTPTKSNVSFTPAGRTYVLVAADQFSQDFAMRTLSATGGGDFTGDLKSDVLWRHATRGDVWLWPMNGAARTAETYVRTVADADWEIRGLGDQTGDGKADILWRNKTSGMIYFWPMNGSTVLAETYVGTVEPAYDIVGTGDYNGDGKSDILWRHLTNGQVWIWLMNGATPLSEVYVDTVDPGYVIKGSGDLNGDHKADIVWHHGTRGEVWVWLMNGTTRTSQTHVETVGDVGYRIVGVADYTGDGRADILWHHATRGEVWIWPMNGTTVLSQSYVDTVSDIGYQIVGNGDYNGDTKADILWHHATRGEVWVWLMNGTTRLSETKVATVPDVGYQIVKAK